MVHPGIFSASLLLLIDETKGKHNSSRRASYFIKKVLGLL
jgi:hypothetical protein